MTRKISHIMMLLIGVAILVACGPSPEEQATMTAASWTATPLPTSTPTPIPYDLSLNVVDGEGNPIAAAQVTFVEREETMPSDESGQLTWANLEGDAASFSIAAQGYFLTEASTTLERGPNTLEVVLERDPFGLLTAEACGANEDLLYVEDFQDLSSPEWGQIELRAGGWDVTDRTDQVGNLVASNTDPSSHPSEMLRGFEFDQAVWRVWFMSDGASAVSFNWRQSGNYESNFGHIDDGRYQVLVDTRGGAAIRHLELPQINVVGAGGPASARAGDWHFIEISTFEGQTQLWIDGKMVLNYRDPRPVPPGTISIEIIGDQTSSDAVLSFDNISVCGLTDPFASIYVAPTAE